MLEKLWIEATLQNDTKVWLNMTEARHLQPAGQYTHVYFGKDYYVPVMETPKALLAAIGVVK